MRVKRGERMRQPGEASRDESVSAGADALVFIPAHPGRPGKDEIVPEVRHLGDGRAVLPAFSGLDGLVSGLGRYQPWAALPLMTARELAAAVGADQVVLDPRVGPRVRRWQPGEVEMLREHRSAGPPRGSGPGEEAR